MKHRTTSGGAILKSLEPGFYSDGETIYVDLGEFLDVHGITDNRQTRLIVWSEIKDIFSDVPVRELCAN
jgi:hypothetical protein